MKSKSISLSILRLPDTEKGQLFSFMADDHCDFVETWVTMDDIEELIKQLEDLVYQRINNLEVPAFGGR